ncbi:cation diffusion facilitator family transporter [Pasteurella canis]|uniref:Cation-efflux pump FieF n=1 Tax=Pasteurella canis TaxID=753 RepID=A0ABQ4VE50_9PAST|nr:cation diffusion facilitator family transporter [Pasteurella canis]MXN88271.1 cation diffusion facilitator family transporter [Pasteurella canis]UAX42327.1 cation diffusion facilitator family transporter [Pasteurella canis]UAY77882.1 cation diffusion facilitator family transporter [Pasteurella canis]UDW83899.1 cation diffusion facilitator family transporter [Pasteurella canis]UEA16974.1 cation diffusion facilitator family transporter [Pasteurella canis]
MEEKIYSSQVKKAANCAVYTALMLIVVKGFAWWETGSVSMLASVVDSTLDLAASFLNMVILRFALMPADENHSFGHGKAESLASLIQSAFISGSAVFLLLQGIHRFNEPQPLTNTNLGIGVICFSIVITSALVYYQSRIVKKTGSPAIKADRLHYQTDLFMNVAILLSLILTVFDFLLADAIGAILIAIYILVSALKMLFDAVQLLLDRALPENEIQQIEQIILWDKRILGFHDLRTRQSGAVRFIQFDLELDDHLSFLEAHDITEQLEQRLRETFSLVDIVIHHEPTSVVQAEKLENAKLDQM